MNRIVTAVLVHGVVLSGLADSGHAQNWNHPKDVRLPFDHMGPFVTLEAWCVSASAKQIS